jgi:GTPase SAR1 family protein
MGQICGVTHGNLAKGSLRVLVLGISGSGKTTFSKQIKILHTPGFTDGERKQYAEILKVNILNGINELVELVRENGLEIQEHNRKHARYLKENNVFAMNLSDPKIKMKMNELWKDPAIQKMFENSKNVQTQMSQLEYLFENVDRFSMPNFIPSNEDILRSRQRTAGSFTTRFSLNRYMWEIIDIGGQQPERVKWSKILDSGVNAMIYFAGLDEYNMQSNEEPEKTKMEVSMECFKTVMSRNDSVCHILFLNKVDLFVEKMSDKKGFNEFKEKFPQFKKFLQNYNKKDNNLDNDTDLEDYLEDNNNAERMKAGISFIAYQFRKLISNEEAREMLIVKSICAINTKHIEVVFDGVKEKIFVEKFKSSGLAY